MVTSWPNSEENRGWRLNGFNEIDGRPEWTRTIDLFRVKEEVFEPPVDSDRCSKTVVVPCSERGILDHQGSTGAVCTRLKNKVK